MCFMVNYPGRLSTMKIMKSTKGWEIRGESDGYVRCSVRVALRWKVLRVLLLRATFKA
jgi:hypothetical protein